MAKNRKLAQRLREWAIYQLATPFRVCFEYVMQRKKMVVLYCVMGNGIGDALALTTILKALYERKGVRGIVFTMYPDLFLHNPMVEKIFAYHAMSSLGRSLLKSILKCLRGKSVICFGGEVWTLGTSPWSTATINDRRIPGVSWIERLLPDGYVDVDLDGANPIIFFGNDEERRNACKFGNIQRPFGIVKASIGLNRPKSSLLKNWSTEGFAQVLAACPEIQWVQIGEIGEQILPGAVNLLGKTTLREVLWLLSKGSILLSVEGFLTHASAAFDLPTVVPFTGIHDANGLLYSCTIPILPDPSPPCAPCWQEECTTLGMPCRENISAQSVIKAVKTAIQNAIEKPV